MPDLNTITDCHTRITRLERLMDGKMPSINDLRLVQQFVDGVFTEVEQEDSTLHGQIEVYRKLITNTDLNTIPLNDTIRRDAIRLRFRDALTQARIRIDGRLAQIQQQKTTPAALARSVRPLPPDQSAALTAQLHAERLKVRKLGDDLTQALKRQKELEELPERLSQLQAERDRLMKERDAYLDRANRAAAIVKERDDLTKKLEAAEQKLAAQEEHFASERAKVTESVAGTALDQERRLTDSETARQQLQADLEAARRRIAQLEGYERQREEALVNEIINAAQPHAVASKASPTIP